MCPGVSAFWVEHLFVPWKSIGRPSLGPGMALFSSRSLAGKRLLALIKRE